VTDPTLDRILDIIDAGLQSSPEADMYSDVAPSVGSGCVRCPATEVAEGGDLCDGCRAFLLGDTDTDPATPQGGGEITPPPAGCRCALCTGEFAQLILADGAAAMAGWLARADDWLAASGGPVVPRPEPDRVAEVTCLECQPGRPCNAHNSDALDALLYAYGAGAYGPRAQARADRRSQRRTNRW
jgi:hypothetical protein